MPPAPLRRITLTDVPDLSRNVAEGMASYAAWAPEGWTASPLVHDQAAIRERASSPGFVGWITQDTRSHVAAFPAADEPGAFHLFHLFVTPAQQGSGIAKVLLDRSMDDARAHGATAMRLRTPRGNARGVAFYRREGWGDESDAGWAAHLGLDVIWMRRGL